MKKLLRKLINIISRGKQSTEVTSNSKYGSKVSEKISDLLDMLNAQYNEIICEVNESHPDCVNSIEFVVLPNKPDSYPHHYDRFVVDKDVMRYLDNKITNCKWGHNQYYPAIVIGHYVLNYAEFDIYRGDATCNLSNNFNTAKVMASIEKMKKWDEIKTLLIDNNIHNNYDKKIRECNDGYYTLSDVISVDINVGNFISLGTQIAMYAKPEIENINVYSNSISFRISVGTPIDVIKHELSVLLEYINAMHESEKNAIN